MNRALQHVKFLIVILSRPTQQGFNLRVFFDGQDHSNPFSRFIGDELAFHRASFLNRIIAHYPRLGLTMVQAESMPQFNLAESSLLAARIVVREDS